MLHNARKLGESLGVNNNPAKYVIDGSSARVTGNSIEAVIISDEALPSYSKAATNLQLTI